MDHSNAVWLITNIFAKAEQREMTKSFEHTRPIHIPLLEVHPEIIVHWGLKRAGKYNETSGGCKYGPTNGAEMADNQSLIYQFCSDVRSHYSFTLRSALSDIHMKIGWCQSLIETRIVILKVTQFFYQFFYRKEKNHDNVQMKDKLPRGLQKIHNTVGYIIAWIGLEIATTDASNTLL